MVDSRACLLCSGMEGRLGSVHDKGLCTLIAPCHADDLRSYLEKDAKYFVQETCRRKHRRRGIIDIENTPHNVCAPKVDWSRYFTIISYIM